MADSAAPSFQSDAPRGYDAWVSLVLAAGASVLYGSTLCPTVAWYDSAEFAASAATLRIVPHPPGYPLYTILGHGFTALPGEPAWGLNVMSAVFGVLCVVLLHRLALAFGMRSFGAAIPPLLWATAPSVWCNAIVAEVYTPGVAFMLLAALSCGYAQRKRNPRWAWFAAGIAGLGLGVHMSVATWGFGFAVLVLAGAFGAAKRKTPVDILAWPIGCIVAATLGAAVFLLIPFGPFETVTPLGPYEDSFARLWSRFIADVQGGVFRRHFVPTPLGPRAAQIGAIFHDNLGTAGLVAAAVGAGWSLLRSRMLATACLLGAIGNIAFFFRYDVPDLDVFLLPSVVSLTLFAGWGVHAAWVARTEVGWVATTIMVATILWRAERAYATVDRSRDFDARAYGDAVCKSLPPDAVLAMTSRPDEWRRYSVVLYMHEAELGCADVEFWGMASTAMIHDALSEKRAVFAFVAEPRFGGAFDVRRAGPLYRVNPL